MKTENITEALRLLDFVRLAGYPGFDAKLCVNAQAELAELQRLVSVVQGFIKEQRIEAIGKCSELDGNEARWFVEDLCDIVGYKD